MERARQKSPYNLLQEIHYPDAWKILISCILLNLTTRKQVDKMIDQFFQKWPDPSSITEQDRAALEEILEPLGLFKKRANTIIRFSSEFLNVQWKEPKELYGIGQYGQDSYDIFIRGKIVENPSDHVLKKYMNWYFTLRTIT